MSPFRVVLLLHDEYSWDWSNNDDEVYTCNSVQSIITLIVGYRSLKACSIDALICSLETQTGWVPSKKYIQFAQVVIFPLTDDVLIKNLSVKSCANRPSLILPKNKNSSSIKSIYGEIYAPVCTKGKKNIPPIGIFCKPTEDRSQVGDEILLGSYQNLKNTKG